MEFGVASAATLGEVPVLHPRGSARRWRATGRRGHAGRSSNSSSAYPAPSRAGCPRTRPRGCPAPPRRGRALDPARRPAGRRAPRRPRRPRPPASPDACPSDRRTLRCRLLMTLSVSMMAPRTGHGPPPRLPETWRPAIGIEPRSAPWKPAPAGRRARPGAVVCTHLRMSDGSVSDRTLLWPTTSTGSWIASTGSTPCSKCCAGTPPLANGSASPSRLSSATRSPSTAASSGPCAGGCGQPASSEERGHLNRGDRGRAPLSERSRRAPGRTAAAREGHDLRHRQGRIREDDRGGCARHRRRSMEAPYDRVRARRRRADRSCVRAAAGHALALLAAPGSAAEVAPSGRVATQARALRADLADTQATGYVGVSLPEEMSAALPLHPHHRPRRI